MGWGILAGLLVAGIYILAWALAWALPSPNKRSIQRMGRDMAAQAIGELCTGLNPSLRDTLRIEAWATHSVLRRGLVPRRIERLVFLVNYTGTNDPRGMQAIIEHRIDSYFRKLRKPKCRYEFIHRNIRRN